MPKIRVNQVDLFYEDAGRGEETIVFAHGYLMTHEMYRAQIDGLKNRYRCIAYDHRGHGQSEATKNGYEMENLYADAVALIDALDCGPCHFVGMSTGGFVGLRLGIRRPDLLKSLILIDTSADAEGKNLWKYNILLAAFRTIGWRPVLGSAFSSLFHKKFLDDPHRQEEVEKWRDIVKAHDRQAAYKFGKGIFSRESVVNEISQIELPTVVMVGEYDVATPPKYAARIVEEIPKATLHTIPDSGHTSPVEQPTAVLQVMNEFLQGLE